jgi:hypothetical protein
MHFSQRILILAVGITATLLSTNAAGARGVAGGMLPMEPLAASYTGSYPVTISHAKVGNGTYCLTLDQTAKNAGSASLVEGTQKFPYGTFQIFNHTLVATIQAPGYGQNAGMVFIGSAHRGKVYGGEAFVEGALAFGMKGGC